MAGLKMVLLLLLLGELGCCMSSRCCCLVGYRMGGTGAWESWTVGVV